MDLERDIAEGGYGRDQAEGRGRSGFAQCIVVECGVVFKDEGTRVEVVELGRHRLFQLDGGRVGFARLNDKCGDSICILGDRLIRIVCMTGIVGDGDEGYFFVKRSVGRIGDGKDDVVDVIFELVLYVDLQTF